MRNRLGMTRRRKSMRRMLGEGGDEGVGGREEARIADCWGRHEGLIGHLPAFLVTGTFMCCHLPFPHLRLLVTVRREISSRTT